MDRPTFRDVFGEGKVILPVIHLEGGSDQAIRNAKVVEESGADGAFLIGHTLDWLDVAARGVVIEKEVPGLWLGFNFLDLKAKVAMGIMATKLNGGALWTDNARINEHASEQVEAQRILDARGEWTGLYFGGVAFKHQREVADEDLAAAARTASPYMDVVTTSGPATGQAASVDKLRTMRANTWKPLAVASGVTLENVDTILPHVDCILVSTGISSSFSELDPAKTRDLVACVHEWKPTL